MAAPLSPDLDAQELAQIMVSQDAEEVHRNILQETLQTAADGGPVLEAGRTVCGNLGSVHPALQRYPTAVDLPGCPITERMGIWHTHITPQQLLSPKHSLPDFANVALGLTDASVVVGSETSHVLVRAEDTQAMRERFEEAVGQPVHSPAQVNQLVAEGEVDQRAVEQRLARAFDPLMDRVDTAYPSLAGRATGLDEAAVSAAAPGGCHIPDLYESVEAAHDAGEGAHADGQAHRACSCFRERSQLGARAAENAAPTDTIDFREIVAGQVVGIVVGRITESLLFGG